MTKQQRDDIRARCEAATPGPWEAIQKTEDPEDFWLVDMDDELGTIGSGKHDAEFIAHAREDIPALLDALDESYDAIFQLQDNEGYLEQRLREAEADRDQLRVQLAGCIVAATNPSDTCKEDDCGWSESYRVVKELRADRDYWKARCEALEQVRLDEARFSGKEANDDKARM